MQGTPVPPAVPFWGQCPPGSPFAASLGKTLGNKCGRNPGQRQERALCWVATAGLNPSNTPVVIRLALPMGNAGDRREVTHPEAASQPGTDPGCDNRGFMAQPSQQHAGHSLLQALAAEPLHRTAQGSGCSFSKKK